MLEQKTPAWLRFLERKMGWMAIPNIAILIITLQAAGFLFVTMDYAWFHRFLLMPHLVMQGEVWRLVTFLALPLSFSPLWMLFVLWFLYYIINTIEQQWGSFKTTFYVFVSWFLTVAFSFLLQYPVTRISHFESTLFLAAAALFPEMEVRLFFAIPVKMKWLAWLTLAFVGYEFLMGGWADRLFLVAIYFNYMLFFGPAQISQIKMAWRRWQYKQKFK